MEEVKTKKIKVSTGDKIMIDESFVPVDSANITPRFRKDGTVISAGFKDIFSKFRDFVVVGGDFI